MLNKSVKQKNMTLNDVWHLSLSRLHILYIFCFPDLFDMQTPVYYLCFKLLVCYSSQRQLLIYAGFTLWPLTPVYRREYSFSRCSRHGAYFVFTVFWPATKGSCLVCASIKSTYISTPHSRLLVSSKWRQQMNKYNTNFIVYIHVIINNIFSSHAFCTARYIKQFCMESKTFINYFCVWPFNSCSEYDPAIMWSRHYL